MSFRVKDESVSTIIVKVPYAVLRGVSASPSQILTKTESQGMAYWCMNQIAILHDFGEEEAFLLVVE